MLTNAIVSFAIAKLLPVLIPPLVAAVRRFVMTKIPGKLVPVILAAGGAAVGVIGREYGVDVPDLGTAGAGAWEGALVSLSAVGVHQLYAQLKSFLAERKA